MSIVFWVVSIALVAFEMVAGFGKILGIRMADEWMHQLSVPRPFMNAFGGLEVGAIGVIVISLFSSGSVNDQLVPWACLLLLVLKLAELSLQIRARAPFAAMVGPVVVIVLTAAFYVLR